MNQMVCSLYSKRVFPLIIVVDICITTAWKELEGVCMLAELLAKRKHADSIGETCLYMADGMEKVICVSTAKVPIVKIWDPELCLACDMNVNNTLALENTRMIKTYVQLDDRVRPLAMIIKYWTKKRVVNDAGMSHILRSKRYCTD
jgi:DNA polymerase sigma